MLVASEPEVYTHGMRIVSAACLICFLLVLNGLAAPQPRPAATALSPLGSISNSFSKTTWAATRQEIQQAWREALGPFPAKPPLKAVTEGIEYLPEFSRRYIKYQVTPGLFVDGYLLVPRGAKGKLPGVVVFHATTPYGARGAAGLAPEYPESKRHGLFWVRQGYVVWCPRNYINTEGTNWAGNAYNVLAEHPNWTGMTRMTWDAIRAADFMESLPFVDHERIACFGHSLGGKQVVYAMAFDPRYCAGVSSEGGIGLRFSNWDAIWYLGSKINQASWRLEHHQLLALIAPRPFLLLGGGSADDDRSQQFIDAVQPLYDLHGAPGAIRFYNHRQGHVYGDEARELAEEFLRKYLR
jgi:hypothetical protein